MFIEKAVDELVGVEHLEVGHFFAKADVADWNLELVADTYDDTAFRSAVEFGECQSIDIGGGGELLGLFDSILTSAGIEHQKYFVRCIGHEFLHHFLDFAKFVHETYLVVETASGIDKYDIGFARNGGLEGVVGHRSRVCIHALLDDGDTYTFGPKLQLLDSGGTESIGSTKYYAAAGLFVLVCQFSNSSGLADSIDTNHEDDVWCGGQWRIEVVGEMAGRFAQKGSYLGTEDGVEFAGANVFVALDAFLQFINDFEGGLDTYIGGDECFFKVVEDAVVDGGFTQYGLGEFGEETLFGFVKSLVETLFFFFFTE